MDQIKKLKLIITSIFFTLVLILLYFFSKKIEIKLGLSPTFQLGFMVAIKETFLDILLTHFQYSNSEKNFDKIYSIFVENKNKKLNENINFLIYHNYLSDLYSLANEKTKLKIDNFRIELNVLEKRGVKKFTQI